MGQGEGTERCYNGEAKRRRSNRTSHCEKGQAKENQCRGVYSAEGRPSWLKCIRYSTSYALPANTSNMPPKEVLNRTGSFTASCPPSAQILGSEEDKGITYYNIKVEQNESNWQVKKRYNDFVTLDQQLAKSGRITRLDLPEKGTMGFRKNAG